MTELPIDENTPRILIVEDEPKLGQLLIDYLRAASYAPTLISHGDQVLPYVRQTPPDLILLDLMLPGTDGLTLCREIRRFSDIPIVMVTAKIEEIDRLLGLEIGADDYICKPFGIGELRARVAAHLRREAREKTHAVEISGVRFDLAGKSVQVGEEKIPLTKSEYEISELLALNHGQVFSKEKIFESVFGYERESDSSAITEHVKNIRAKFARYGKKNIQTVWGIGYKWE